MGIRVGIFIVFLILESACVSSPSIGLREIAHYDTVGWAHSISLDDGSLYVADRQGGYLVFSIASGYAKPRVSAPVRDVISLSPNSGVPVLASRFEGLVVTSPSGRILDSYSNGDIANAVEVRGDLAFAAYGLHGLVVLRLRNGHLQLIATLPTNGWSHDLRLSGNQALLADWKGLRIVDIGNPEKPSQIAFLPSPATCLSLSVKDIDNRRIIALAEGHAGIALVQLDPRGRPSLLSRNYLGLDPAHDTHPKSGGWIHSVAWAGQYLIAANWKLGLSILDVRDARNPQLILQYPVPGTALGVKTQRQPDGSYLIYLADGESGLWVFSFTGK